MRFARIVFVVVGLWGLLVLTPLFFLVDITGRQYFPPTAFFIAALLKTRHG
jgi:hypothetical protein